MKEHRFNFAESRFPLRIFLSLSFYLSAIHSSRGLANTDKKTLTIGGLYASGAMTTFQNASGIIKIVNQALQDINERSQILPGYKLDIQWRDTKVGGFYCVLFKASVGQMAWKKLSSFLQLVTVPCDELRSIRLRDQDQLKNHPGRYTFFAWPDVIWTYRWVYFINLNFAWANGLTSYVIANLCHGLCVLTLPRAHLSSALRQSLQMAKKVACCHKLELTTPFGLGLMVVLQSGKRKL